MNQPRRLALQVLVLHQGHHLVAQGRRIDQ